jgi:hypothetical protein
VAGKPQVFGNRDTARTGRGVKANLDQRPSGAALCEGKPRYVALLDPEI